MGGSVLTPQHQALKMRHWLTGILFISLQLSDGSVKLFKDNQELQEYEARKVNLNRPTKIQSFNQILFIKDVRL